MREYAGYLEQFVSALGLEQALVLGHSWGSALALELYRRRPTIVTSLVLVGDRPAGTRTMARAIAEGDLRDLLPRIEVPTLLIDGDADERSPLDIAHELHGAMPGSRLTVMPGLGHECYLESAEVFDTEVRSFLLKLEP